MRHVYLMLHKFQKVSLRQKLFSLCDFPKRNQGYLGKLLRVWSFGESERKIK